MRPTDILLFLILVLLVAAPVAGRTTEVQVIRYAGDGTTVLNSTTVNVSWMESHLPIAGDGATPYAFQGAILDIRDYSDPAKWNPAEDQYIDKINDTVRGTYLKDLCDLIGGMQPGGEVRIASANDFGVRLGYDNVYSPMARQGPPFLAWWGAIRHYDYAPGLRLFFAADTSVNPYGLHVFGNEDMRQTLDEKYWGWFGGQGALPAAAQLSVHNVTKVQIFPAPSSDWTVLLNGSITRQVTKSYFEQGLSWPGHRANFTDANGVWEGMPLWRLVGYVDDGNEHADLAFNRTLAEQGYTIRVIAADGYNRTFTSQEVAFSTNYIVANTLNGTALPTQINGRNVWPLRLVGLNATGGKSVANITEIRVEGVPVTDVTPTPTPTPPIDQPWMLQMTGYTDFTVSSDYFAQALSCGGHTGSYTDTNNVTWDGLPLWRLVGLVDDQVGHEDLINAYNETLADEGYTVRVIAGDGYNRTFTSREIKRSTSYIVASKMNGTALPVQINGKNVWPLKLVGANATGGKSIGNITEIRLENLPIVPPEPNVLFDGDVTLAPGTFDAYAYNSNTTHAVPNLTVHGALQAASVQGGFGYNATDKKWADLGTFLLDGIAGVNSNRTANTAWAYTLNGVPMNDFSADQGISVQPVANGDQVVFYFGTRGAGIDTATAVVRLRVMVPDIGGDTAFFLVSTTPPGASIYREFLGGTQELAGNTSAGPLNVTVYLTGTPVRALVAKLPGYRDAVYNVSSDPPKGQTVPVDLVLEPDVSPTPTVTVTPETPGPFGGAHVPSTRIEAEHFDLGGEGVAYHDLEPRNLGNSAMRAGDGVDLETGSGVTNVAFIRAGEYLRYSVDTTIAGDFTLTLRAANPDMVGKAVRVSVDGVPAGEVLVGGTGGWTAYRDFTGAAPLALTTGRHVVTLSFDGVNRINLDWLGLAAGPVPATTTPATSTPYPAPHAVPGRVEAEDYDVGGFADTTAANEGGAYRNDAVDIEAGGANYDVGWIRAGEYLEYSVDTTAVGTYTVGFRVANPGAAKTVTVRVNGAAISLAIPPTGSFGAWQTATLSGVALHAGRNTVRIETGNAASFNLDYLEFSTGAPTTTPPGSASFTAAPNPVAKSSEIRFTVTPAAGKSVRSCWWTFDSANHYGTWNSRAVNPAFFYPAAGTYTPLVKITYTDGTTETVQRPGYVTVR